MLGSRVVLAWVMLIGVLVGAPLAIVTPTPDGVEPSTVRAPGRRRHLLRARPDAHVHGAHDRQGLDRRTDRRDRGRRRRRHRDLARRHRRPRGGHRARGHRGRASCSPRSSEPTGDVPAGDFDFVPRRSMRLPNRARRGRTAARAPHATRRRSPIARCAEASSSPSPAALVFGVGLVASGRAAAFVPAIWVALAARFVGHRGHHHPDRRSPAACG